ncbi:translocon-associated protein beta family protein-like protein [Genlisea aurea]|uniref:Translocon-associated protein beta family protein-like protein n=1 Tax=Genlisea aurea TaxID=192259 RepID=S8CUX6_9LAMI|nr:translocon-associated protein beta family protein-like protein [Genlisea aurea]
MANGNISVAIFFVVGILLLASSAISENPVGPFVLAHKKASLTRIRNGYERVSVSIDVYNQGSATAFDVSLIDDTWSQDIFSIVSGNTSVTWERLDVGSIQSHSFELETNRKTEFYGSPATITFRVPTNSAIQVAYSTPILPLEILADKPAEKKFDWAKRVLVKYGSLVSVVTIVVLFVYLVATPSKSGTKKKR